MKTSGLILAAGLSGRMVDFKTLMPMNGKALIEHSIDGMLIAGIDSVTVVLGYRADEVKSILLQKYNPRQVRLSYNGQYAQTDMLHSVKTGILDLPRDTPFFLLPGDMPAVSPQTFRAIQAVMQESGAKVVFPTVGGRRKHPPLISAACIPDILAFTADGGLRKLWRRYEASIATAAVDDPGCTFDNDTPQDFKLCSEYMKQTGAMRHAASV